MSVGEGLAPPAHGKLELQKMYGDFVEYYAFTVHFLFIVMLYRREGQAPPLRYSLTIMRKVNYATRLFYRGVS